MAIAGESQGEQVSGMDQGACGLCSAGERVDCPCGGDSLFEVGLVKSALISKPQVRCMSGARQGVTTTCHANPPAKDPHLHIASADLHITFSRFHVRLQLLVILASRYGWWVIMADPGKQLTGWHAMPPFQLVPLGTSRSHTSAHTNSHGWHGA